MDKQYNIGERPTVIIIDGYSYRHIAYFSRFHRDSRILCMVVMYLYPYYITNNNYYLYQKLHLWHGRCKPGGEYTPA